jgi:hypothetical protein
MHSGMAIPGGYRFSSDKGPLVCPTLVTRPLEKIDENLGLSNRKSDAKNRIGIPLGLGASAAWSEPVTTPDPGASRAPSADCLRRGLQVAWAGLSRREKRAVQMLALALYLGRESDFYRLAGLLNASLTTRQRVRLAWAALSSLDPEPREHAFEAAQWGIVE